MGERGWGREESGSERDESEERVKVETRKVEGSFFQHFPVWDISPSLLYREQTEPWLTLSRYEGALQNCYMYTCTSCMYSIYCIIYCTVHVHYWRFCIL